MNHQFKNLNLVKFPSFDKKTKPNELALRLQPQQIPLFDFCLKDNFDLMQLAGSLSTIFSFPIINKAPVLVLAQIKEGKSSHFIFTLIRKPKRQSTSSIPDLFIEKIRIQEIVMAYILLEVDENYIRIGSSAKHQSFRQQLVIVQRVSFKQSEFFHLRSYLSLKTKGYFKSLHGIIRRGSNYSLLPISTIISFITKLEGYLSVLMIFLSSIISMSYDSQATVQEFVLIEKKLRGLISYSNDIDLKGLIECVMICSIFYHKIPLE